MTRYPITHRRGRETHQPGGHVVPESGGDNHFWKGDNGEYDEYGGAGGIGGTGAENDREGERRSCQKRAERGEQDSEDRRRPKDQEI